MDSAPHPTARPTAPRAGGADARAARLASARLTRELVTMRAMLRIHCRDHHPQAPLDDEGLCADCGGLLDYARKRLAGCPYGIDKPTCANCQIHCYGPTQRAAVREVMRYAGPRMLLRHPYLSVMHVVDGKRPAPPKPRAGKAAAGAEQRAHHVKR